MFNQKTYLQINNIIFKISNGDTVTLQERLIVKRIANNNPEILHKLKKAQCNRRLNNNKSEDLTNFMGALALDGTFKNEHFNPELETIGEWFSNAPKWLRRS